ncbi:gluconokinase [Sphingomonas dokdonensis]|uniref:Gluconokinase n=1 Tax=Sphingomonas dokdonensis TaxID=344880 RepID=A0A245ZL00_9SPHN|nr:gluconokinase [Sphingomonas dokdonensis]OWK30426.1 thermoresistant gluconokinase [Sphingomonas dokdonensis]
MLGAIVIMGVSGSGKSTLGTALARALDCRFLEGDAFHSAAAVEKMQAGQPLDDDDRWPWLDRLGDALAETVERDDAAVAACSALRRRYRERLAERTAGKIRFILLDGDPVLLKGRLRDRRDHFMPPRLLASQIATLEPPGADEQAITLPAGEPITALCAAAMDWLGRGRTD